MRRTRVLWFFLAATALVLALVATMFSARDQKRIVVESAALRPSTAADREREPAAIANTTTSASRTSVNAPLPESTAVAATSTPPSNEFALLSGRFVFEDGSSPPEASFVVCSSGSAGATGETAGIDWEAERSAGRCVGLAYERTNEDGSFDVGGLCAGDYSFRLTNFSELRPVAGHFQAPGRDLRVVLRGHLLKLTLVDALARPLAGQRVVLNLRPKDPQSTGMLLERYTDEQGSVLVAFHAGGEFIVEAEMGLRSSPGMELSLQGPSAYIIRTLVIDRWRDGASLSVAVVACDIAKTPIESYCLSLTDVATRIQVQRVCSEEMGPDGFFHGIKPGRYRVAAVPRFNAAPVMYLQSAEDRRPEVELVDGRRSHVELCVEIGGRIAVRLLSEVGIDVTNAKGTLQISSNDGTRPVQLDFRDPDETGVTISFNLPFGIRRSSERVILPGRYSLMAAAGGMSNVEQVVVVQGGKVTDVDVVLRPRKH